MYQLVSICTTLLLASGSGVVFGLEHVNLVQLLSHETNTKRDATTHWQPPIHVTQAPTHQSWSNVVDEHNHYRSMAPATNMQLMRWDDSLAASAQKHASRCTFSHSTDRVNTGENLWAASFANYSNAVKLWHDEVNDPACGCGNTYKHCCGHYTQIVWATSTKIGCGFADCGTLENAPHYQYILVCQYRPAGNLVYQASNGVQIPLPAYTTTSASKGKCSECPKNTQGCYQGLCY